MPISSRNGIARIDVFACGLPMKKPVKMASELITRADNVFVRLEAGGVVGWGEAGSAPGMTGETIESMQAAVRFLTPHVLGREIADVDGILAKMDAAMYGNKAAKAAIEIALHDCLGKTLGMPVHALLGTKRNAKIATMATVGSGDSDKDVAEARALREAGYAQFKIKVGIDTPERDAARSRLVCDTIGDGCTISADANQGYSTEGAIIFARAMTDTRLDFFEAPVRSDDLAAMAAVAAASRVPVGADEGVHSYGDIERHAALKAAKGMALKCIKLGGVKGVAKAGALCERLGLEINVSCKTGESSVASAAAAHAAAVLASVRWGLSVTQGGLAADVTERPPSVERGTLTVSDAPGLGIEVDERLIRKFAI
jgi:muconate cycloisomerase